jgi:hypothetical protein
MPSIPVITAIRNACVRAVKHSDSYYFHNYHKQWTTQILHVMGEYNSQKLTPKLQKLADDYSVEVFGSTRFAPWLYVYSAFRGEFKEGWIPDNFYVKKVCPRINSKELRHLTDYKSFSNVVLKSEALPDIAYYIEGIFYTREFSIVGIDVLREQIFSSHKRPHPDGPALNNEANANRDSDLGEDNAGNRRPLMIRRPAVWLIRLNIAS